MKKTVTMKMKKETPGAVQYVAVDEDDNVIPNNDVILGGVYLRKNKIKGKIPEYIEVIVRSIEE